jgi:hypothetical protein
MATVSDLEERVRRLEADLAALKQRVAGQEDALTWIERVSGSMKDFPEFEEVVRLGRDLRKSHSDPYSSASDASQS